MYVAALPKMRTSLYTKSLPNGIVIIPHSDTTKTFRNVSHTLECERAWATRSAACVIVMTSYSSRVGEGGGEERRERCEGDQERAVRRVSYGGEAAPRIRSRGDTQATRRLCHGDTMGTPRRCHGGTYVAPRRHHGYGKARRKATRNADRTATREAQ